MQPMYTQQRINDLFDSFESLLKEAIIKSKLITPCGNNKFKYNDCIITQEDGAWNIYVGKSKVPTYSSFLKVSAFAICKLHEKKRKHLISTVQAEDKIFQKNYLDSVFHKHMAKATNNIDTKLTAIHRFEISHYIALCTREKITNIFYSA